LNIEIFKSFITVAKLKSISKASELLFLTQPAITKQIQYLEQEYNKQLFDRSHKELRLTEEGEILLDFANRILGLYNESFISLSEKAGQLKGILQIAASLTTGIYILPRFIKFFREAYPQIRIEMSLDNTDRVLKSLKKEDIHFGFIGINPQDPSVLLHSFYQDKLTVVVGPGSKIMKVTRWKDLEGIPFIGREKGSDIRSTYENWFKERIVSFNPAIELNNTEAIKSFLSYNMGFSILPWSSVEQEINSGALRAVSVPHFNPIQDYYVCFLKKRNLSTLEKVFVEHLFQGIERDISASSKE
jgi:LysR family transcriptional regulator, transcriptional activator of the cysJI operon